MALIYIITPPMETHWTSNLDMGSRLPGLSNCVQDPPPHLIFSNALPKIWLEEPPDQAHNWHTWTLLMWSFTGFFFSPVIFQTAKLEIPTQSFTFLKSGRRVRVCSSAGWQKPVKEREQQPPRSIRKSLAIANAHLWIPACKQNV